MYLNVVCRGMPPLLSSGTPWGCDTPPHSIHASPTTSRQTRGRACKGASTRIYNLQTAARVPTTCKLRFRIFLAVRHLMCHCALPLSAWRRMLVVHRLTYAHDGFASVSKVGVSAFYAGFLLSLDETTSNAVTIHSRKNNIAGRIVSFLSVWWPENIGDMTWRRRKSQCFNQKRSTNVLFGRQYFS